MWTAKFWKRTAERVVRSAAWAAGGSIGATSLVQDLNWAVVGGTAGTAALLCLIACLVGSTQGNPESPSLIE